MKRNTLLATALSTAFAAWAGALPAGTISLQAVPASVNVGDTVQVQINMDFTGEESVGGGLDVTFDNTKLQYQSYSPNTAISDPAFQRGPTLNGNKLEGITAGGAGVAGSKSLTGTGTIGTLTFQATAAGTANLSLSENTGAAGGFYGTSGNKITPTLAGTSVAIAAADACEGDLNGDKKVNIFDYIAFRADYGRLDCNNDCAGDLNNDGKVNIFDYIIFRSDYGRLDCP